MVVRTHLGRGLNLRLASNWLLIVIVAGSAIAALSIWLSGTRGTVWLAPAAAIAFWVLGRELDPDHGWTAVLGSAAAGIWALSDHETMSLLAIGALAIAARMVVDTTGRRPLTSDQIVVGAGGIAIGFTVEGWVGGFCLALAVFLNARFRGEQTNTVLMIAGVTAIGTTVVATAADAFPQTTPDLDRLAAVLVGLAVLSLILREPAQPLSTVDARHSTPISQRHLHVGRLVAGGALFVITLLAEQTIEAMAPAIFAVTLYVVSNEVELVLRRHR